MTFSTDSYKIGDKIYLLRTSYKPIPLLPVDLMHLCISFSSDDTIPFGVCTTDNLTHLQQNSIGYFGEPTSPLNIPGGIGRLISPDPFLTRNIEKAKNCEQSSFEILSSILIIPSIKSYLDTLFNANEYSVNNLIERIDRYGVKNTYIYQNNGYSLLANFREFNRRTLLTEIYNILGFDTSNLVDNHYHNCVTWIRTYIFKHLQSSIFGLPSEILPFENNIRFQFCAAAADNNDERDTCFYSFY